MKDLITKYNALFEKYEVNTPKRLAMFMSQCSHESGGFKFVKENLNYSAQGLCKVFSKYFTPEKAKICERQPEKIANIVYANRMGNGNESSGDGFRYRGRGYIQLTGKENYTNFAKHCNKELNDSFLKWCESEEGAIQSALWFWNKNNLNQYADTDDIKTCTKKINGGFNGLEDRIKKYEAFKKLLNG